MKNHKIYNLLLILFFFIFIWLPLVEMEFHPFPQLASTENRVLQPFPSIDLHHLDTYPTNFESYFDDNFGFRTDFVLLNNLLLVKVFQYSPVPLVTIGKKGWLFITEDFTNVPNTPYTTEQLSAIKSYDENQITTLKRHGIYALTVVVPNKSAVYPEYLSSSIRSQENNVRYNQRIKLLSKSGNEVALLPALLKSKKEHQLYYATNSHWNLYGSFTAYQEIMKRLSKQFPQLDVLSLSDFSIQEKPAKGGDLAALMALQNFYPDTQVSFTLKPNVSREKLTDNKKLNKVIIFYDSFFDTQYPWGTARLLSYHFKHVVMINKSDYFASNEWIYSEKPDVVIFESVERFMELHLLPQSILNNP